jgi:TonB family protein
MGRTLGETKGFYRSAVLKHLFFVVVVISALIGGLVFSADADTCPVRLEHAGLVGLGAQHGTAAYELMFGPGAGDDNGPFDISVTAEMSDGTQMHFEAGGVSTHISDRLVGRTGEITLFPFATEVSSFRIDSARDWHGISTCSEDSTYSIDSGSASQAVRFDDGPTSQWPVKSPGAIEIDNARFISRATPNYPAIIQDQGIQGEARVLVVIQPDGSLGSASIERSSGNDQLDQAALAAARDSTFAPAHLSAALGSASIVSVYFVLYTFKLDG